MASITIKSEQALATYLASVDDIPADVNIARGRDSDGLSAPIVICSAHTAGGEDADIGLWEVEASIITKEIMARTDEDSTLSSIVQEAILGGNIAPLLTSSTTNYVCHDILVNDIQQDIAGKAWVQTLNITLYCSLTA